VKRLATALLFMLAIGAGLVAMLLIVLAIGDDADAHGAAVEQGFQQGVQQRVQQGDDVIGVSAPAGFGS
jgi:hypothetical protein